MKGIFSLKTPTDLRDKLRRDLERFKADPLSADAAFNFFVTAEHMVDWTYPGKTKEIRQSELLLQLCSHLANGAKHFEATAKQHRSVASTGEVGGWFPAGWFPEGYFPSGYFPEGRLLVNLKDDAAAKFGDSIGAVELAEKVMEYWAAENLG